MRETTAPIFLGLGAILCLVGTLMLLNAAYRQSLGWFLSCLLLPFASYVFLFMHVKKARLAFGVLVLGLLIGFLGASLVPSIPCTEANQGWGCSCGQNLAFKLAPAP